MLISPLIDPFALHNVVDDTSPQLGGNLDGNDKEITNLEKLEVDYLTLDGAAIKCSQQLRLVTQGDTDHYVCLQIDSGVPVINIIGATILKFGNKNLEGIDNLKPNSLTLLDQSSCTVVRESSTQVISTGTWTKVRLNSEWFDQDNEFDNTTNYRFTATEAGTYLICFSAGFFVGVVADKKYIAQMRINNSGVSKGRLQAAFAESVTATNSIILKLAANDYVELWVYHNAGNDVELDYNGETFLSIFRLA